MMRFEFTFKTSQLTCNPPHPLPLPIASRRRFAGPVLVLDLSHL